MDNGISLPTALGAAQALYGEPFDPMVTLKALAYFGDGDLQRLSQAQRQRLVAATSGRFEIPQLRRKAEALSHSDPG